MPDPNSLPPENSVRQNDHPVAGSAEKQCLRCGFIGFYSDEQCRYLENEMPDLTQFLQVPGAVDSPAGKLIAEAFRFAARSKCDAMSLLIQWGIAKPELKEDGVIYYQLPDEKTLRPVDMLRLEDMLVELAARTVAQPEQSRQPFIDQLTTAVEDYKTRTFRWTAAFLKSIIPQTVYDPDKKPA